jgi:phosphotransferase system HPr (HPr) family protein
MKFVDVAKRFVSDVSVCNVSKGTETVDGKSAMEMMLLEATQGSVLRIIARGADAEQAADALAALVRDSFGTG